MVYDKPEKQLSLPTSNSTNVVSVSNEASSFNHAFWIAVASYIVGTESINSTFVISVRRQYLLRFLNEAFY
mgnify:CR=1 FL=1